MNRAAWLLDGAASSDRIIEIGPSYSPIAPKSAGWRTHVVDHASQTELRAKYAPQGVNVDAIEPVDTVWPGGALHEALPVETAGTFARLIASHVIEHIPDLIGFFESASHVLDPRGVIALAVPDLRHCFDFFKPWSMAGDALEAHAAARSRHTRRTVWNQAAYSVSRHGVGIWGDDDVPDLTFTTSFDAAARAFSEYDDTAAAAYVDCHTWHFTPAHFQLMMLELGQLGAIDWRVETLESAGAEFLCTLRRGVARLGPQQLQHLRMEWLYRGLADVRAQIDRALDGHATGTTSRKSPDWGALSMVRRAGPRK